MLPRMRCTEVACLPFELLDACQERIEVIGSQ